MNKNNLMIITAIIAVAVISIGTFTFLSTQSQAVQITNNVTSQGTKLNIVNNNNQNWVHTDLVIPNVTAKDGTVQTYYIETWTPPGGTTTIDLSNMLGYGNAPLPTGTSFTVLTWAGLFNSNPGGTGTLDMNLLGWSNTPNPGNPPVYPLVTPGMTIGPKPASVTASDVRIGTTLDDVHAGENDEGINLDLFELQFTQITMTVDPSGNMIMTFTTPPTICTTIAHII